MEKVETRERATKVVSYVHRGDNDGLGKTPFSIALLGCPPRRNRMGKAKARTFAPVIQLSKQTHIHTYILSLEKKSTLVSGLCGQEVVVLIYFAFLFSFVLFALFSLYTASLFALSKREMARKLA